MKPFSTRKTILDGVDDARADLVEISESVKAMAVVGMIAFALISVVALAALARSTQR